jgi:sugar lactone lactonase YvrE
VYAAEPFNNTIRKITPNGVVTTFAGSAGTWGSTDGIGASARFSSPQGVATDSAGNVYVADTGNYTIRKITPAGVVTTLAGIAGVAGSADGIGASARFNGPQSVATDSAGNVYVADFGNDTIRKITPDGLVTTLAGAAGMQGSIDGMGAAARFNGPYGVAVDASGNVYVADFGNDTIRKITPDGLVTTLAGAAGMQASIDGIGAAARFNGPYGAAVDASGNVYVADTGNDTIRKITPAGVVTTLAGTAGAAGSTDGIGAAATLFAPQGVATDSAGNLYVASGSTIRKITPAGVVSTFAGGKVDTCGMAYCSTDGMGAAASFGGPVGVAADSAGNIYVADTYSLGDVFGSSGTIRKITPAGLVSTFAGTAGTTGSTDGTGAAARFNNPTGLATDSAGNIYVADSYRLPFPPFGASLGNTIRKITPAGVVSTFAGTAGTTGSTDGTGAAVLFSSPQGVATDSDGNVYVADTGNSTIRKITSTGVVTTLAGIAGMTGSTDGVGAAARFNSPVGVAVDGAGNVYVADTGNDLIRKITPSGAVTTIVGRPGEKGFLPGPLPGLLSSPQSVALFGTTLYTTTNNAIVQVSHVP